MLVQTIRTNSSRPLPGRSQFGTFDTGLFASAAELLGMSLSYGRDEEIYGEGEDAEFVYKVASGAVRTYKLMRDGRRQIGGFHLAGDLFGLDIGGRRHLTAEAVMDSKIIVFNRRQVEAVVAQNLAAARELWLTTANHLQHAEDHMLLLGRKTAIEAAGRLSA